MNRLELARVDVGGVIKTVRFGMLGGEPPTVGDRRPWTRVVAVETATAGPSVR